jgi:hypothetical protein
MISKRLGLGIINVKHIPFLLALCVGCAGKHGKIPTPESAVAKAVPGSEKGSTRVNPNAESQEVSVIRAKTAADLHAAVGKTVQITGVAQNSKASAMLLFDDGSKIFCSGPQTHWPDDLIGKRITVTGRPFVSKTAIFPSATQDKDGNWSQGIVSPQMTNFSISGDGTLAVEKKPLYANSGELMLEVVSYVLAD